MDDKQVERLLKQIGQKADRFDMSLDQAFNQTRTDDRGGKNELRQSVKDLRQTTDRLRDRVKGRQSGTVDAEEVLRRGGTIDSLMQRYQLSTQAEQNWLSLRGDLDRLARAYYVAWNWSNPAYTPAEPGASFSHRLTGTYLLENDRSDDPRRAAELAARGAPSDQRQRTYESLLSRLDAPDTIAIERIANSVTMESTRGPRVTFEADGRDHGELMMRIGLLGCGNIGHIIAQHGGGFEISSVYDKASERAKEIGRISGAHAYEDFESFIMSDIDIVVEAASVSAVKIYAGRVLSHKKDLVIMSVGALSDSVFQDEIRELAKRYGQKIHIPSGAIFGLDNLKIGKISEITRLLLRTCRARRVRMARSASSSRSADRVWASRSIRTHPIPPAPAS